jgi:phytoene desaturase
MTEPHLIIIGGGLAGLSTGCYARASGFRTTIIEHNLALGGVCTAWPRGPYTIDGCIHWLTGGPFDRLYEELGILSGVERRVLDEWLTYRDAAAGASIRFVRDLDALRGDLLALAPTDAAELDRVIDGARKLGDLSPPLDHPRELTNFREQIAQLWELRHQAGTMLHFRAPIGTWTSERLKTPALRRLFETILPPEAPAMFLCMVLGYLERGYLSRPIGGTARFRDALIASYERAGGESRLHATVEEIIVEGGRAAGVRLTARRLLGGRYDADQVRGRMATWKLFDPIVLASFGVALALRELPPLWILDRVEPFDLGGVTRDQLYIRITNDDASLAPAGHVVVQAMLGTSYEWWATRGSRYAAEKDAAADIALTQLERHIPGLRAAVQVTDVSTPLTFWNMARSWRGAFEGWMPTRGGAFDHVAKMLGDLRGFYMAGQWVEPGGGVPTAILSGRQAAQLACAERGLACHVPPRS